jgi:hypothetical protein
MSRYLFIVFLFFLSAPLFAEDLALKGFQERFSLVRNPEGKVASIRLKKLVSRFSLLPFIEQIKQDLIGEQNSFHSLTENDKREEIDQLISDLGFDPYLKMQNGSEEIEHLRQAFLNIQNIDINNAFAKLNQGDFWKEFEAKLNEAFLFIDPTILVNLEDSRFFYKRTVTYEVVRWALEEVKKRFSDIPVLNIASFIVVRVHDMMLEQRHFHHNMLLHYFETISEDKLTMTKEEIDRTVSSIFEYRIEVTNIFESNRAAADWSNYGMNNFYRQVRAGNTKIRNWQSGFSDVNFSNIKKLNFAFAQVKDESSFKIYHLHHNAHQFSGKPALAFDYSNPGVVKRNRAILNLAGVALGFIRIPQFIKANVDSFIKSFYVSQVRTEGALVGYFESQGKLPMIKKIYAQRANFYIVE